MALRLNVKIPLTFGTRVKAFVIPGVRQAIRDAMAKIPSIAIDRISQRANAVLHTTAPMYNRGLTEPGSISVSGDTVTIALVGAFPNALETGFEAFDIKAGLLRHATRFSKQGLPYVDVPFRHGMTPGGTSNMQSAPADVRKAMTQAVWRAQAALRRQGASAVDVATASARLRQTTPGREFDRTLMIGGQGVTTRVKHRQGIHDDLLRTAVYGHGKAISTYRTFRRVSANSDPLAWWHPGFHGVKIFDKIAPTLEADVKREVVAMLAQRGLKVKP